MIQIYKKIFLLLHVIAFAFCCASIAESKTLKPWTGKVVGISDGDTISVMRDRKEVKIRLAEIDCPEGHQPFGGKAKQFTSDRCFKKMVTVHPTDKDRYGRIVAHVKLLDGRDLGEELLRAGLAWHFKKYSKSQTLAWLEADAKKSRLGLWSQKNPIPPWGGRHKEM